MTDVTLTCFLTSLNRPSDHCTFVNYTTVRTFLNKFEENYIFIFKRSRVRFRCGNVEACFLEAK